MKLRPFELALVIIFGVFAGIALILLATNQPGADDKNDTSIIRTPVEIWGTLPEAAVTSVLDSLSLSNESFRQVSYRYVDPTSFDNALTNALADGVGPDLLLVSHEQLVDQRRRLQPFSYETYPLRDFRSRYVDGAELFARNDGIYALPIAIDPLMLYYNRNILSNAGFLKPPATWEELITTQFPTLIERDFDRTIFRSVVAMGEYENIRNAFGMLSALLLQGGSGGVTEESDGAYRIRLQEQTGGENDPLRSAADFYVRFSKPSNTLYSWNRSFTEDRAQFVSEDLVFYFGYGSEARDIERLNPNLNFDIAEIPQGATATVRRTYGRFYGLSALRSSDNLTGAYTAMTILGALEQTTALALAADMVPAYREAIAAGSNDTYGRLTFMSAAVAYGWLNPDINATNDILETMTRDINENRRDVTSAANDAVRRLQLEYN
ncbi:MAG: hypothetical protein AAB388_02580 [Patescibacteria group bacterium]